MDTVTRCTFAAMSCSATIVLRAGHHDERTLDTMLRRSVDRVDELERRWSRFRPDSEITGLNGAGGAPRRCSADTVELVTAMAAGWAATDGRFDPSLLGPLVELGYATSRTNDGATTVLDPGTGFGRRIDLIRIDRAAGVVRLPRALTLDPGGIGKGLAADIVTRELVDRDADEPLGALVEIGGDVAVRGDGPDDGAWTIEVAHPFGDSSELVRLASGGVATSTTRLRTWHGVETEHHHLLDPATGRSTGNDVVGCTVVAGSASWAEVFTKCAFVEGLDEALARYEARGLAARVVTDDGSVRHTTRWTEFAS